MLETSPRAKRRWKRGLCCRICGCTIHMWQRFNFDHSVPVSRGGRRGRINKHLAHSLCNAVKGNRHPFSLKRPEEREQIRPYLREQTWLALCRIWAGGVD